MKSHKGPIVTLFDEDGNRLIGEPSVEGVGDVILEIIDQTTFLPKFCEDEDATACPAGIILNDNLYPPDAMFGMVDDKVHTFHEHLDLWVMNNRSEEDHDIFMLSSYWKMIDNLKKEKENRARIIEDLDDLLADAATDGGTVVLMYRLLCFLRKNGVFHVRSAIKKKVQDEYKNLLSECDEEQIELFKTEWYEAEAHTLIFMIAYFTQKYGDVWRMTKIPSRKCFLCRDVKDCSLDSFCNNRFFKYLGDE